MRQIAPAVYKLRKTIKNLLQPEAHYLLAVSGGADSLALAHACAALAAQGWGSYSVCHVEHGLRGEEALRDMQAVQRACKDWGLPCFTEHVQAASYAAQNRLSTEDAARRLRYAALRRIAEQQGAAAIVTAHHEGDQAETLLLRLLRGAGLQGLAGMRAQQDDIIRPLLTLPKSLLEEYCSLCRIWSAASTTMWCRLWRVLPPCWRRMRNVWSKWLTMLTGSWCAGRRMLSVCR